MYLVIREGEGENKPLRIFDGLKDAKEFSIKSIEKEFGDDISYYIYLRKYDDTLIELGHYYRVDTQMIDCSNKTSINWKKEFDCKVSELGEMGP